MKKTLTILLAMSLLCIMAVGSTVTYFTDQDFAQNIMTVGKVDIKQIEDFTPNSPLRPYIGTIPADDFLEANNAVKKTVTVENTGSETAFIRTLVAFEAVDNANPVGTKIHVDYNKTEGVGTWDYMGPVEVASTSYFVYSFTYTAPVDSGATTAASLEMIALDCTQDNEFSTLVGVSYDVLVVSQAVQAAGFESQGADVALKAAFSLDNGAIPVAWFTQN